jgi:phosphoglucosamine mutase
MNWPLIWKRPLACTLRWARMEPVGRGGGGSGDVVLCLAVSTDRSVVDGDQISALSGPRLPAPTELKADMIVATAMSNLVYHRAMRSEGRAAIMTAVGDRHLLESLRERGLSLGGE